MTDIKTALKTLAEKSKFIADAKNNKDIASEAVNAATDQAILAAIAVGDACNGELPDKRVLKKRFPDAITWDDVQANLLTYARLIMQGQGVTVTVAKTDYEVDRKTLADAPAKLSTVATSLRKHFDQQEVVYGTAATMLYVSDELPNGPYASPEHIRAMVDSEKARQAADLPYSEDIVKAWDETCKAIGPDAIASQEREKEAEKVLNMLQATEWDAEDGPNSAALYAILEAATRSDVVENIAQAA